MRTKIILIFLTLFTSNFRLLGQVDTSQFSYGKLDTITCYWGAIVASHTPIPSNSKTCNYSDLTGPPKYYFYDCQKITEDEYNFYIAANKNLINKLLYVKWVNKNGVLIFEGDFHLEYYVGNYFEYYPSGILKISGQYMKNQSRTWFLYKAFKSNRKEGLWKYYNEKGEIIKTELYRKNKLVQ